MTGVYSGGLVYEYSNEGNGYGLVNISSTSEVIEGTQFDLLQTALSNTTAPTGDGGYNSTSGASVCPPSSSTWNVSSDALPAIPAKAAALMSKGAGTGAGLKGAGSQEAGGSGVSSSGTATAGSGAASTTASGTASTSKSAAGGSLAQSFDKTPMILGFIVSTLTLVGAVLI